MTVGNFYRHNLRCEWAFTCDASITVVPMHNRFHPYNKHVAENNCNSYGDKLTVSFQDDVSFVFCNRGPASLPNLSRPSTRVDLVWETDGSGTKTVGWSLYAYGMSE